MSTTFGDLVAEDVTSDQIRVKDLIDVGVGVLRVDEIHRPVTSRAPMFFGGVVLDGPEHGQRHYIDVMIGEPVRKFREQVAR